MTEEQIRALLAEQEATLQELVNSQFRAEGAILILREQLRQIDAAKVVGPEE